MQKRTCSAKVANSKGCVSLGDGILTAVIIEQAKESWSIFGSPQKETSNLLLAMAVFQS